MIQPEKYLKTFPHYHMLNNITLLRVDEFNSTRGYFEGRVYTNKGIFPYKEYPATHYEKIINVIELDDEEDLETIAAVIAKMELNET